MKAVILAGGFATRLRPISYAIPKLLFPVAGKPMIYWTLDMLKRFHVDEVILCVNYLADALRETVGDEYRGVRVLYSLEDSPLGTAGPIKLASRVTHLSTTFIAMNGDIVTNLKLDKMLEQHQASKMMVTDALHEVQDPSRFGVVEMDPASSKILRFVEKPTKRKAPSRLINAGIYLIEPSVLKIIPSGRKVSLEKEIFPILAERGKLAGYHAPAFWFDIGSLSDYRKANFALTRRITDNSIIRQGGNVIAENSRLVAPCIVGRGSKIGQGALLGPNVVIGKDVHVGERVVVSNSILFDNVEIGDRSNISGAIIGSNSSVGQRVEIANGAIVSPGVHIHDMVRIGRDAVIHPHREVAENIKPRAQLM